MRCGQIRELSEAVISSTTEEELADWYKERGTRVLCHQKRYWKETFPGFYQSIHWMAQLTAEQITRPAPLCWGFQAVLHEGDKETANGALPVHLLHNLEDYDIHRLTSNRRNHLRRCYKRVQILELTGPDLLREQGYAVMTSALKRTEHAKIPSKNDYLTSLNRYIEPGRRLILAGLIGNKLGGYISGHAVSGIAYIDDVVLATDALSTYIGSGLQFEFAQVCRRSEGIRELVHGLHTPENHQLCIFKEGIGFRVKQIPTKVEMFSVMKQFIRWKYPYKYYRLTGREK